MCESCRQWDHSSTVTKRQLAAGDTNLCVLFRCVCKSSSEYVLRNLRKRAELCSPIASNLLNLMLDQRGKLEDVCTCVFLCRAIQMERGCEGVQWDPLKPCLSDFGSCSLRVGSVWGATLMKNNRDGRAASSNSLVKTFLQCSYNVPTMLLPPNHGLRCSQYVLGMFSGCCGVPLMSPCLTLSLLWKLGPHFEV